MSEAKSSQDPQFPDSLPSSATDHQRSVADAAPRSPRKSGAKRRSQEPVEDWQDWETVDFPNAISVDAIDRQSMYDAVPEAITELPPIAEPTVDEAIAPPFVPPLPDVDAVIELTPIPIPAVRDELTHRETTEEPSVAELVVLIQDLNQCNQSLLERVQQLETALHQSQHRLEIELERSRIQQPQMLRQQQELEAARQEMTYLLNQLEFANQANQRQQILVETLTTQLENSQERIAQLERECTLGQQQYHEQTQRLAQLEDAYRDVRTRLQRQQRYTLQFKAALEKCLEVPSPMYGALLDAPDVRAELPAVPPLSSPQGIQPWSAGQDPTIKGDRPIRLVETSEPLMAASMADEPTPAVSAQVPIPDVDGENAALNLPDFAAPAEASSTSTETPSTTPSNPPSVQPSISYTLKQDVPKWWSKFKPGTGSNAPVLPLEKPSPGHPLETAEPAVVVEEMAIANLLDDAESFDYTLTPTDPTPAVSIEEASPQEDSPFVFPVAPDEVATTQEPAAQVEPSTLDPTLDLDPTLLDQLNAAVQPLIDSVIHAMRTSDGQPPTKPEEPPASDEPAIAAVPVEQQAEDLLWRDLARLIDVSTDDVVKASLSGDFQAFSSIDFDAAQVPVIQSGDRPMHTASVVPVPPTVDTPLVAPEAIAPPPETERPSPPNPDAYRVQASDPSSPPILYPDRPVKKRPSLAAVQLPSFPRL
jgi:hypothetical protein